MDGSPSLSTSTCDVGGLVDGGVVVESLRRTADVAIAGVLILLTLPLLLTAMLAIRLTSRGPVMFSQQRVGRGGQRFRMFKIRTMRPGAEHDQQALRLVNNLTEPVFKLRVDPRVTPVGRWLRRFSIDELPQLFNVLRGEMAIVGPRPLPPEEVRLETRDERVRLRVKPGLTCLWQIAGRNEIPYAEWVALDRLYVEHRSLWLDVRILAKTPWVVLSGHGAY